MEKDVAQLWQLISDHELIAPGAVESLKERVAQQPNAEHFDATAVAKCLVASKALTLRLAGGRRYLLSSSKTTDAGVRGG